VIWWIAGALVLGSLVILALAVLAVARRVGRAAILARRLRLRVADVERSTLPKVAALQERAERMQEQVATMQERAELLKAGRVGRRDS
jgi:hypothetical protein